MRFDEPQTKAITTILAACLMALGMSVAGTVPARATPSAVGADPVRPQPVKRLTGLRDTYWYVPAKYLPAYQRSSGSNKKVSDQTVWHFTQVRHGYLLGCSYRSIDEGTWTTSSIVGSVAPDNHVVLGFYGRTVTVGQGSLVRSHGRRYFLMQVAGGPAKTGVVHWAYMARATPTSPAWSDLPGTNGESIPSVDTGC